MQTDVSEFSAAVQAVADERYTGNFQRGFAHVAIQVAFPTYQLTDEQAADLTSVDRTGDLGCDGLYIDDEAQELLLFQAKSSSTLRAPELHSAIATFLSVPSKLVSDD